ncbi:MAG: hypothetical protein IJC25_03445, partial [Clostridia bacterium]|nr:hypothetical protein [Clostridia bacterium]
MNKKLFTTLLLAAALCVCLLATGCSSGMARDLTNADFVYNYLSEGITDRMTVWGCTPLKVSKVELISENGAERLCTVTAKNEAFTVIGDYVLTYEGKQLAGIKEADDFDQQVILTVPKSVDTVTSEQFKDF